MSPERVDDVVTVWSKRIGLVFLGWLLHSEYHDTYHMEKKAAVAEHAEKVAGCEKWRANKAMEGQPVPDYCLPPKSAK